MDGLAKLIEALAQVLKAVAWPGLVAFVIWHFRQSIQTFLDNIGEASFKGLGIEASARRREIVASIVTAQLAKGDAEKNIGSAHPSWESVRSSIATANVLASLGTLKKVQGKRILWADDHPEGNRWERKALESMGMQVTTVTSTEAALEEINSGRGYDLLISDMTRGDNKMAGYDLLAALRKRSWLKPYIIYAGSASPDHERIAIERGASGRASDPEMLIRAVVDALIDPV